MQAQLQKTTHTQGDFELLEGWKREWDAPIVTIMGKPKGTIFFFLAEQTTSKASFCVRRLTFERKAADAIVSKARLVGTSVRVTYLTLVARDPNDEVAA